MSPLNCTRRKLLSFYAANPGRWDLSIKLTGGCRTGLFRRSNSWFVPLKMLSQKKLVRLGGENEFWATPNKRGTIETRQLKLPAIWNNIQFPLDLNLFYSRLLQANSDSFNSSSLLTRTQTLEVLFSVIYYRLTWRTQWTQSPCQLELKPVMFPLKCFYSHLLSANLKNSANSNSLLTRTQTHYVSLEVLFSVTYYRISRSQLTQTSC